MIEPGSEIELRLAEIDRKLGEIQAMLAPPAAAAVSVTAGPFATIAAVRDFEERLRSLPDVVDATVRGYEGADRAIFDLRLTTPTS